MIEREFELNFLTKYCYIVHYIVQLRQLPYNADIVLCVFWLFHKLKNQLKAKRFDDVKMQHLEFSTFT